MTSPTTTWQAAQHTTQPCCTTQAKRVCVWQTQTYMSHGSVSPYHAEPLQQAFSIIAHVLHILTAKAPGAAILCCSTP
jgi:hypothetical protein